MCMTTLTPQPADDGDLIAALAAWRGDTVQLRPGFVVELRACLVAEIANVAGGRAAQPHDLTAPGIRAGLERGAGWAFR